MPIDKWEEELEKIKKSSAIWESCRELAHEYGISDEKEDEFIDKCSKFLHKTGNLPSYKIIEKDWLMGKSTGSKMPDMREFMMEVEDMSIYDEYSFRFLYRPEDIHWLTKIKVEDILSAENLVAVYEITDNIKEEIRDISGTVPEDELTFIFRLALEKAKYIQLHEE